MDAITTLSISVPASRLSHNSRVNDFSVKVFLSHYIPPRPVLCVYAPKYPVVLKAVVVTDINIVITTERRKELLIFRRQKL